MSENETDSTEMTIRQIIMGCEPMGNLEHLLIDDLTEEDEDQFFGILEDLRRPNGKPGLSYLSAREGIIAVIASDTERRATKTHRDRFDEAAANIEARPGSRTKLEELELDAVRSLADDLRVELSDFDCR